MAVLLVLVPSNVLWVKPLHTPTTLLLVERRAACSGTSASLLFSSQRQDMNNDPLPVGLTADLVGFAGAVEGALIILGVERHVGEFHGAEALCFGEKGRV